MNWLYLHGNIIKLHKFLISHVALNKTSLTYTNILALFGLVVMLCDHEAESAKYWDNFLSHCKSGGQRHNVWRVLEWYRLSKSSLGTKLRALGFNFYVAPSCIVHP